MMGFLRYHFYIMESCYACVFSRLPRAGDITLGDFWRCPEPWQDKRGVSVVFANTPAGLRALEALAVTERIVLEPTDLETATKENPRAVTGKRNVPKFRRAFLKGVVAGRDFRALSSEYFSKAQWRSRRSRFFRSDAKPEFLAEAARRRFGRSEKKQA